jgi:hypothetical protein
MRFKQFLCESMAKPNNVNDAFIVGDVAFDNHHGLGATPNSANILYRGAVAWIKPSKFIAFAAKADRAGDAHKIADKLRHGKAIAVPWLDIDIIGEPDNPTSVHVTGHEGRARALAVQMLNGDNPMPVQLQLAGLRARHLTPAFFSWLEHNGMTIENSTTMLKPEAKSYFWNLQDIHP